MTTRRTGPSSLLLRLAGVCLLAASMQACYTLVRHPGIPTLNYQRPSADSSCNTCHDDGQRLAFVSPVRVDRARAPWGDIAHPWWFGAAADSARSDGAPSH